MFDSIVAKGMATVAGAMLALLTRACRSTKIERIVVSDTELCGDECEALRAGVCAGIDTARRVLRGEAGHDLDQIVDATIADAAEAYGRYLEVDEHAEG